MVGTPESAAANKSLGSLDAGALSISNPVNHGDPHAAPSEALGGGFGDGTIQSAGGAPAAAGISASSIAATVGVIAGYVSLLPGPIGTIGGILEMGVAAAQGDWSGVGWGLLGAGAALIGAGAVVKVMAKVSKARKAAKAGLPKIRGHTRSLRTPELVDQIKADMLRDKYFCDKKRGIISGIVDKKGVVHLQEGQLRMNAALEIFEETGDSTPVKRLLEAARRGIDGRTFLNPGEAPSTSLPLPRR